MTSKRSLKIKTRILNAFVLFLAALTIVIAFAAPAPQAATAQSYAKSSATRPAMSRLQTKRHAARVIAPDNSLSFLPAVGYDSGGDDAYSVTVADVNGDGKPDIIVANVCAHSNTGQCAQGLVKGRGGHIDGERGR